MSGIWISAATIARFAVAGSLMTLMAGGQSAPKAARTIVEQTSYFALPGKAEDVYRVRLHASDVLEKLGLPRGHVLRRQGNSDTTPATLDALLGDLPDAWTAATEGPGTWSPFVVIGHLIHAEKADWIPRLAIILEYGASRPFEPFDREAQIRERDGKSLPALLQEFADLRLDSIVRLRAMQLTPEKLELKGMHPGLGIVTARQLMATWTAHDLGHLLQISPNGQAL